MIIDTHEHCFCARTMDCWAARQMQRKLLKMFLKCAKEERLPVVLHVRSHEDNPANADVDMLSVLSDTQFEGKMVL